MLFLLWAEQEGSGRLLLLRGEGALFLHPHDPEPGSGQQLLGTGWGRTFSVYGALFPLSFSPHFSSILKPAGVGAGMLSLTVTHSPPSVPSARRGLYLTLTLSPQLHLCTANLSRALVWLMLSILA